MSADRLKTAIALYLEHRPQMLEKSLEGSQEPYDHRARGSSRPPTTAKGHLWMDEGVTFTKGEPVDRYDTLKYLGTLNAICEAYRLGIGTSGGVSYAEVMNYVWEDPAAVRWMRDGKSENARAYRRAFDSLVVRIAGEFSQIYPGVEMWVSVRPEDVRTEASTPVEARRIDEAESRRRRYAKLQQAEATGMSRGEAKKQAAIECDVSVRTIERDAAFCEGRLRLVKRRHSAGYIEVEGEDGVA